MLSGETANQYSIVAFAPKFPRVFPRGRWNTLRIKMRWLGVGLPQLFKPQKTYPRFYGHPYYAGMKLNLVEINKLSPRGLWDLEALSAVISMLHNVLKAGIGGQAATLIYVRMIAWHTTRLRDKTRENLNMRIKAWVMQCPERISWVRGVIGEAAIRRWRKNRLANYALSKYFGDWKKKFPDGFQNIPKKETQKPKVQHVLRPYNWKPFALTKIFNVERFLYGRSKYTQEIDERQAAYFKLWGVDIRDTECLHMHGAQPREQRSFIPVAFTPYELEPEAATGPPDETEHKPVEEANGTILLPPPKPPLTSMDETVHIPPEDPVPETSREPPS